MGNVLWALGYELGLCAMCYVLRPLCCVLWAMGSGLWTMAWHAVTSCYVRASPAPPVRPACSRPSAEARSEFNRQDVTVYTGTIADYLLGRGGPSTGSTGQCRVPEHTSPGARIRGAGVQGPASERATRASRTKGRGRAGRPRPDPAGPVRASGANPT